MTRHRDRPPNPGRRFRPSPELLELRALLNADVTTYQYDNSRTGADTSETTLTPVNVNPADFGRVSFIHVDGKVDAQPLYVADLRLPGLGTHNVLFVATENDSLYAFDADDAELLWHDGPSGSAHNLLPVGEIAVQAADLGGLDQTGAELGILDTPVIDPTTGTLYVVVESRSDSGGTLLFHQRIQAINILNGADRVPPVSIDASVTYPGTNPTGSGSVVSFDPNQYKERDALTLANGVVYTAWSSNADNPPYTGWIIGFDAANLGLAAVLNINPDGSPPATDGDGPSGGTFWNSGGGFSVDAQGNLYNASANGPFDATLGDYGDTILKLSTANGLTVSDYFTPYNEQELADTDTDLGSSDVLLLPDLTNAEGETVQLAVTAGKDGSIYVVNRDDLGQFNATSNSRIYQELPGVLDSEEASAGAYFNGTVYYGANGQPLRAFTISDAKLSTAATSATATHFPYPGTSPTISANGTSNGIVWAVENNGTEAVLHAFDATNLGHELYNSAQAPGGRDDLGPDSKFIVPMVANGKVYVGTDSGVAVFGLLDPPAPTPPPPTALVPAFSTPDPVVEGPTYLGVIGADGLVGESSLKYTWSTVSTPAGAPAPDFSGGGTNASKLVRVAIKAPGSYTFEVTIEAPDGQAATSAVTIQVAATRAASAIRPRLAKADAVPAATTPSRAFLIVPPRPAQDRT
jgi:hypothetical protein